jgi:hypothetical protein
MAKSIVDLSPADLAEFYSLYNAFKAADEQDHRAKASWKFLCFVYKHLGDELLTYFVDNLFKGEHDCDAKRTIASMIRMRAFIQPHLN